jgi:alkanesulfonate monooxygenase SsuD/methylene tetrahydromethanopterin reductase-like flavin-dependent oxidoreductase (luciferase family)
MLREYLEAMQALWSQEEAEYQGEFVRFGPSWAWPKTLQQPRPPVLVGASGTDKTFDWIVRSADGWITTPREHDIDDQVRLLQKKWHDAGRDGEPRIVALDGKPDPDRLAGWAELGVTDVLYGTPDRSPDEVLGYLDRLAAKLPLDG